MMRGLCVALLAVNLLLMAWLIQAQPPPREVLPSVDPGVERLVLLSERQGDFPEKVQSAEPIATVGRLECYSLGSFPTQADARAAATRLSSAARKLEIRSQAVETEIGNWVYIPSLPNREAAREIARRLEATGVQDFYIIGAGNEENTISLGLYREPGNAQGRVEFLQSLGFDPLVSSRTETVPRYWIHYAADAGQDLDWETLLASSQGLKRDPVLCE